MKQESKEECTGALTAQGSLGEGMSRWTTSTPSSSQLPGSQIGIPLSSVSSQIDAVGSSSADLATIESLKKRTQSEDLIGNPKHYTSGSIQTWDYIVSQNLNYLEGNVIKYVTRYKHKNGLEDLLKAKAYLDKLIAEYPSAIKGYKP